MEAGGATLGFTEEERAALSQLEDLLKLDFHSLERLSAEPAEILPHLLLGSRMHAICPEQLKKQGVTHVLNCASAQVSTGTRLYAPHGIVYDEFKSDDREGYNIMAHFDQFSALADEVGRQGGRLFVHCEAGVNRSGTLSVAYHVSRSGMSLLDSARHCKKQRGRICTNADFQVQLFRFALSRNLPLE
uniref:protein-tyrosine-phosphatase n=1 Tax=Noctiluca scintillans TaxID=2966 RepID=A0A7S1FDJ1_NOCSC|mmetsp:Transcript_52447/g.139623  ORF Transcript_52447/g.139623 Transcript_52447/m.139623 type:complete len:188 (+) Transcript_52447:116-679(+)|eukprot:CAMPEP_0194497638 /NCGR_PEP_ID=MMETSP0253-20130528/14516_1 /TAXON_ID=2966 /ORGANISM="Noctiluca scintillans" /LENGTH=187 /DNA_ID=CAMNT_0039339157 /DNA_START=107 /DNA_END=670 /DNA_ORIENTATION=-